jgi:CheY-like chemotaxis protein
MKTILVVEDDASLRDLLKVHLGARGYQMKVAGDAAEAIRGLLGVTASGRVPKLAKDLPDLILCDVNLPYLDGLELVRALKGDPVTGHIPVIILTGRRDDDTFVRAMKLGVTEFITKPVPVETLLGSIESALSKAARPLH